MLKIKDLTIGKLYIFKNHPVHIFKSMNVNDYTTIGILNHQEPFLLLGLADISENRDYFSCYVLDKNACYGWIAVAVHELELACNTI